MRNKLIIGIAILAFGSTACQKCGQCYVTIDAKEELDTRSPELCGDDYESLKNEETDIVNAWQTVYPDATVKYVCEDK